ncbi:MAG: DUF6057 family protein, partial [Paraprevotella sp.]|nr:DUF6057 family protein [Paraprevotella sp.]
MCGSLFTLFTVLYLSVMQTDLLATAQHLLSKGQTLYSPWAGTGIVTSLLLLFSWVLRKFIRYPLRFHALYYFLPCVVLGLLTSIVPGGGWQVRLSAPAGFVFFCLFLFVVVSWVGLQILDHKHIMLRLFSFLWGNLLLLALQFGMVGAMADTNDVYHYRLRAEKQLVEGRNEAVLQVGRKSLQSDRGLTAIRAFALSRCGMMGDELFEYPQYYGSDGLMPSPSDTAYTYNWASMSYTYVGGRPGKGIHHATLFFERLMQYPSATPAVRDYLLCTYLLDKNLDAFAETLPKYYAVNDSLPLHYKEAVVLYDRLRTNPCVLYNEASVMTNFNDFVSYGMPYK